MKNSAQGTPRLAEQNVRSAVHDVANANRRACSFGSSGGGPEVWTIAPPISRPTPANPHIMPEPGRAAVEYDFAEHAEQDLRRAAAGGPSDVDHEQPQDQRHRLHIAQAFAVFVPGPDDLGFG